jgi:hypothetical protein
MNCFKRHLSPHLRSTRSTKHQNDTEKRIAIALVVLFAAHGAAQAYSVSGSIYSTNGSQSDVQSAIDAAPAGAIVMVPAGTFSGWNVELNKAITLAGAGSSSTIINGNGETPVLSVDYTGGAFRVTGIQFNGGTEQSILTEISGNNPGLFDHCTWIGGSASEMVHNMGMGAESTAGWKDDIIPGSGQFVYFEDCTFSNGVDGGQYFWGTSAIESYYGARTCIRYCVLDYCQIDQHGTEGMIGARWWEFYENTFTVPANGNQSNYFALRGGSGVVFNNHMTGGPNTGSGSIELYSDDTANPPPYGPGAGIFVNGNLSSVTNPAYIWGNDSTMSVVSGSNNVIAGLNYFVSATKPAIMMNSERAAQAVAGGALYVYSPYVYPHPANVAVGL